MCVCFTPDEEICAGTALLNYEYLKSGCETVWGVTLDGTTDHEIVLNTFNAHEFTIEVEGYNVHPGYAFNKMENSILKAQEIIAKISATFEKPETTQQD